MAEEESAGVLIKGFDFIRAGKPAESATVKALKHRRQEIQDMADTEKGRLDKATEFTKKYIQDHVAFLEDSLEDLDNAIANEGDTLVPSPILHEAVAEFRDQELTLDNMNEVANLVTSAYQERGYILARAYVPEQEIKDGILQIAILEGDVGEVKVTGQTYYSERVIRRNFLEQVKHGVVREDLLERGLLLSQDLPGSETRIVLQPGEKTGSANVVLKTEDRLALNWTIDFNNFGSEFVSKERYGTYIDITDPWWGSTLSLRGVTGNTMDESLLGKADLSVPITIYGTKLNLSYMKGLYVVGQELADLGMDGDTTVYGIGFSHPFIREKNQNLTVSVGYESKNSRIFIKDELENLDDLNMVYATVDYDSLDRYLGKSILSMGVYRGKLNPSEKYPFSRKIADLDFARYNLTAARIQKIYGNVNFMVRALGQYSSDNLLPIEETGIGGYGTVRGHNLALFLGDTGYSISGELLSAPPFIADKVVFGQRISQMVQFSLFYDYGRVYYTSTLRGEMPDERLQGYGGGVRLYYKDFFTFKFDLARPMKKKAINEKFNYLYFMTSIDLTSKDFRDTVKAIKDWWRGGAEEETPAVQ
ncbi:MAG TPA: ShlB/FhaC/HecB family hemolysin secretion/activation protein [Desulfatiglandales bacterium]|nr:ShlB/FhaC/HecB family hemolysin secretion/activation protein [Desulfatiglandales bacterium]